MDAHSIRHLQWPRTAHIHGVDNVIFPQPAPSTQPTSPSTRSRSSTPDHQPPHQTALSESKPWWQRLLIDAMLIPFTQGFMLNLAINWVRYWRQTGGLMGLFRKTKKSQ